MKLIRLLFGVDNLFKDDTVVSLSALRKRKEYIKVTIPDSYKKTYVPNIEPNYLLF